MSYLGDFAPAVTLDFKFTTRRFSSGAPFALASGVISVYKDNSTTQSTAGVTLSADFDGVTGLNNVRIDTSADGSFYAAGSNFQLVITTGTVDSVSVVGEVLAQFSLNNRSLQSRVPAALLSGRMDSSVGAMAANVMTAAAAAADLTTELQAGLATAAALATAQTSIDDVPTNPEMVVLLATADDAVLAAISALNAVVALVDAKTTNLPPDPADQSLIITATDAIIAAIAALNNISAAQAKAEMVAALNVDTYGEPTGVPAATASLVSKLGRLHQALRNGLDVTATAKTLRDDAGVALWKKTLADDGTTYSESEASAP